MSEHIGYLCSISIPRRHGYARRGDVATGNPGVIIVCCATRGHTALVIRTVRHKGLRRCYESGSTSGIRSAHTGWLHLQLVALDTAYTSRAWISRISSCINWKVSWRDAGPSGWVSI